MRTAADLSHTVVCTPAASRLRTIAEPMMPIPRTAVGVIPRRSSVTPMSATLSLASSAILGTCASLTWGAAECEQLEAKRFDLGQHALGRPSRLTDVEKRL